MELKYNLRFWCSKCDLMVLVIEGLKLSKCESFMYYARTGRIRKPVYTRLRPPARAQNFILINHTPALVVMVANHQQQARESLKVKSTKS
jgi:hypothetical protein